MILVTFRSGDQLKKETSEKFEALHHRTFAQVYISIKKLGFLFHKD